MSRSRYVECPLCGSKAYRADTRKADPSMKKILRIRLYLCVKSHEFETAETVVGEVRDRRRHDKQLIYSHSIRRLDRREESDYVL